MPDVVPSSILAGPVQPGGFSLVAGDFEEVYGPSQWLDTPNTASASDDDEEEGGRVNQRGRWGAVVTCFFIDTARSILNYLRIIHGLLDDGGVWINLGPLLWHFENAPASAKGEMSIELSLDEVKELARTVGFEIKQERMVSSTYTGVPDNMLQHVYNVGEESLSELTPASARSGQPPKSRNRAKRRETCLYTMLCYLLGYGARSAAGGPDLTTEGPSGRYQVAPTEHLSFPGHIPQSQGVYRRRRCKHRQSGNVSRARTRRD